MAIKSFANAATKAIFEGQTPKGLPASIMPVARRKLGMIASADALNDLRKPPGNRLHPLVADRVGQHAIRINAQYRVCFIWTDTGVEQVEITDYH